MKGRGPTRRELLATAVHSLWGLGSFAALAGLACDAAPERRSLVPWLSTFEAGHDLGRRYLAERPGEAEVEVLREAIFGPDSEGLEATSRNALEQRAAARIREDFAEGRVVALDRWVLSETEARLFAWSALVLEAAR